MNEKKKTKEKIKENKKENKKEITKSYFTLDSVKHSLHIFYFGNEIVTRV